MKRFICLFKRVKIRFYVAAIIVLFSIAITPQAVDAAYRFRGYEAIGGEALIIHMGILLAWLVCDIMKEHDLTRERRKDIECTQNNCER